MLQLDSYVTASPSVVTIPQKYGGHKDPVAKLIWRRQRSTAEEEGWNAKRALDSQPPKLPGERGANTATSGASAASSIPDQGLAG